MTRTSSDVDELIDTSRELYRRGTTDGLPVVPPTEERVERVLRGTDLPPGHELAKLGNREGSLTVQKLAINAVMAGCRAVHLPFLVAGVRALADPDSNAIQTSVSTGSWAYFWLINGPVRNELGIGHGRGAFGDPTNRVIGRALGLAYKNTALIHPGEKDMGVMGNPAKYSLVAGENEERSPWEPGHVTAGFDADESTITLGGPNGFGQYTNHRDPDARSILAEMVQNTASAMVGKERESYVSWVIHGLAPDNATVLADAGFQKRDVKEYLRENTILAGSDLGLDFISRDGAAAIGSDGSEDVPSHWRRQIDDPKNLKIPVLGDGGRENLVIGPSLGGPVTKAIEFPDDWDELTDEFADGTANYPVERFGL